MRSTKFSGSLVSLISSMLFKPIVFAVTSLALLTAFVRPSKTGLVIFSPITPLDKTFDNGLTTAKSSTCTAGLATLVAPIKAPLAATPATGKAAPTPAASKPIIPFCLNVAAALARPVMSDILGFAVKPNV